MVKKNKTQNEDIDTIPESQKKRDGRKRMRMCQVKNNALEKTGSLEMSGGRIYGRECGGHKKTVLV